MRRLLFLVFIMINCSWLFCAQQKTTANYTQMTKEGYADPQEHRAYNVVRAVQLFEQAAADYDAAKQEIDKLRAMVRLEYAFCNAAETIEIILRGFSEAGEYAGGMETAALLESAASMMIRSESVNAKLMINRSMLHKKILRFHELVERFKWGSRVDVIVQKNREEHTFEQLRLLAFVIRRGIQPGWETKYEELINVIVGEVQAAQVPDKQLLKILVLGAFYHDALVCKVLSEHVLGADHNGFLATTVVRDDASEAYQHLRMKLNLQAPDKNLRYMFQQAANYSNEAVFDLLMSFDQTKMQFALPRAGSETALLIAQTRYIECVVGSKCQGSCAHKRMYTKMLHVCKEIPGAGAYGLFTAFMKENRELLKNLLKEGANPLDILPIGLNLRDTDGKIVRLKKGYTVLDAARFFARVTPQSYDQLFGLLEEQINERNEVSEKIQQQLLEEENKQKQKAVTQDISKQIEQKENKRIQMLDKLCQNYIAQKPQQQKQAIFVKWQHALHTERAHQKGQEELAERHIKHKSGKQLSTHFIVWQALAKEHSQELKLQRNREQQAEQFAARQHKTHALQVWRGKATKSQHIRNLKSESSQLEQQVLDKTKAIFDAHMAGGVDFRHHWVLRMLELQNSPNGLTSNAWYQLHHNDMRLIADNHNKKNAQAFPGKLVIPSLGCTHCSAQMSTKDGHICYPVYMTEIPQLCDRWQHALNQLQALQPEPTQQVADQSKEQQEAQ